MADRYVIAGVSPYDGEYILDDEQPLTTTEWGWIKRRAGYLPLTMTVEALADPEVISVLAAIAVRRAGTIETTRDMERLLDRLFEAPFGDTVSLLPGTGDDEEDDAGPPPQSSTSSPSSDGDGSTNGSDPSDSQAPATGHQSSATSASARQMSVT